MRPSRSSATISVLVGGNSRDNSGLCCERKAWNAATAPPTATACLKWRRIGRWIAYANSVVEEGPGSPGPVDSSGREERC